MASMSRWMRFCTDPIEDVAMATSLENGGKKICTRGYARAPAVTRVRRRGSLVRSALRRWLVGALGARHGRASLDRDESLARAVEARLISLERPALPLAHERGAHLGLHLLPHF